MAPLLNILLDFLVLFHHWCLLFPAMSRMMPQDWKWSKNLLFRLSSVSCSAPQDGAALLRNGDKQNVALYQWAKLSRLVKKVARKNKSVRAVMIKKADKFWKVNWKLSSINSWTADFPNQFSHSSMKLKGLSCCLCLGELWKLLFVVFFGLVLWFVLLGFFQIWM